SVARKQSASRKWHSSLTTPSASQVGSPSTQLCSDVGSPSLPNVAFGSMSPISATQFTLNDPLPGMSNSKRQSGEQPSPATVLPSSHSSPGSTMPSPHAPAGLAVGVGFGAAFGDTGESGAGGAEQRRGRQRSARAADAGGELRDGALRPLIEGGEPLLATRGDLRAHDERPSRESAREQAVDALPRRRNPLHEQVAPGRRGPLLATHGELGLLGIGEPVEIAARRRHADADVLDVQHRRQKIADPRQRDAERLFGAAAAGDLHALGDRAE